MPLYTKESIETLRQRIDLVEVLMSHMELRRAGAAYKALCPFHEEKTPSFTVQKGDSHYHCFGCGAHGDAIAFLMGHLKLGFVEAVESLAERFQVHLEKTDEQEVEKGPSKPALKHALELTAQLYHYLLLHTQDGHEALHYLYERGIDLEFIRRFHLGFSPKDPHLLSRYLHAQHIEDEVIEQAGLVSSSSKKKDFFSQRIMFPIRDPMGAVIGFSGRKFKEETFGGKYINTPETLLFKKSRVLFGLSYSRQRIAKERKAIIVEGQIDALRLINSGFDYAVAGQGTAFGADHARELIHLGVSKVYLALDGDDAGQEAAAKIGHLFLQKGIDIGVLSLPDGSDPDSLLLNRGPEYFSQLIQQARDYLTFLFRHLAKGETTLTPSRKNEIIKEMTHTIKSWEEPVMVHESLKKLAEIAQIPESALGIDQVVIPEIMVRRTQRVDFEQVNPDRILDTDCLRWLILASTSHPEIVSMAHMNIHQAHFRLEGAYRLYQVFMEAHKNNMPCDVLSLGSSVEGAEAQKLLNDIMQRKINRQKVIEGFTETVRKMLIRQWMEEREAIRIKLHSTFLSDEEESELARQFDAIKSQVPQVKLP